jgi:hypothetical protein
VDNTTQIPKGLAGNITVKILTHSVPTDFMVLDIGKEGKTPIILGRPLLSTPKTIINNGIGQVHLLFPGEKVRYYFRDYISSGLPAFTRTNKRS